MFIYNLLIPSVLEDKPGLDAKKPIRVDSIPVISMPDLYPY
jgi:hypothetical protein